MWTSAVLAVALLLVAVVRSENYSHRPHSNANRNERIIKVHGPPYVHHNHHHNHGHHKHIRNGPLGLHLHHHAKDHDQHYEYIRPHHAPPIPPFYNGHNNNHVKHLPRPPPSHPHHKTSPFGTGFPHKTTSNSFRAPVIKDHFRNPTISSSRPTSHDYFSSPISHIQSSDDNAGPIHEIPAPNLGPKPVGDFKLHLESEYPSTIGKTPSLEVTKFINDVSSVTKEKGPGYEVTESNHSNDHVIESHDGSKSFYAPDPDPSLPVHKVPPTNDPHSIPSHGKKVLDGYVSPDIQILDGGSIPAPVANLSPQELYNLMHGYQNGILQQQIVPQPVVTILSQPQQPSNLVLPPQVGHNGQHYLHHSSQTEQYLQQPELHNALHQEAQIHGQGLDHSRQSVYAQGHQYQHHQLGNFNHPSYQSFNYNEKDRSAGAIPMENYQTSQINDNYHYEQDASETKNNIGETEAADNDADSTKHVEDVNVADNQIEDDNADKSPVFDLKTKPEVPFYTTLPNKQAAEVLATLQAAGSIASNYVDKIQGLRGDQPPEQEGDELPEKEKKGSLGLPEDQMLKPQKITYFSNAETSVSSPETGKQEENVQVQKSIPLYEASYLSTDLLDDQEKKIENSNKEKEEDETSVNLDFRQKDMDDKFGRRIRRTKI